MNKLPEHIRTFIAFRLPDHVKEKIAEFQRILKKEKIEARYIPPKNMHLTLKFIGDMESRLIIPIEKKMKKSMQIMESIPLSIKGVGAFPNKRMPRVIWAGVNSDGNTLTDLHRRLDDRLGAYNIPGDNRTYTGHLTLARLKKKPDINQIVNILERFDDFRSDVFNAGPLVLFRSELTSAGPIYTELASV